MAWSLATGGGGMSARAVVGVVVVSVATLLQAVQVGAAPGGPGLAGTGGVEVSAAVHEDVSPPLRLVAPRSSADKPEHEHPLLFVPPDRPTPPQPDGALQTSSSPGPMTSATAGLGFDGVGAGFTTSAGSFTVNAAPPDTNGAVGATQYVQWVNEAFAVFDKATGRAVYGPAAGNTLWAGFGGGCEANNDGDPIAQYDKAANRWVLTQFSITNPTTYGYLQCVAVSTTSDATGAYYRYAFAEPYMNDYPKLGVWPDGYYLSFNMFNGSTFVGARACALDRTAMLAGAAATQQCFDSSSNGGSLLPADLDGSIAPPAGSPDFFVNLATNSLRLWRFHVDFAAPQNTTFVGPVTIPVASFAIACGGGSCVPQKATQRKLDSLGDRPMYRLAYRHFADGHEALVFNHSVSAGSSVGVRWYELRDPNGSPSVFQQGTFAPDATYRWMASAAMDKTGDLAVGYSVSSASIYPGIRYAGRVPTDPLGTLEAETSVLAGAGSQNRSLSRWGDYSAMSVDPVDDCTFWYTTEYLKTSGTFNWSTRIVSFKVPTCA